MNIFFFPPRNSHFPEPWLAAAGESGAVLGRDAGAGPLVLGGDAVSR